MREPLKGLDPTVEYSANDFLNYFKELAESDEEGAGWKTIEAKEWGFGKKKKARQWLEETGATGSWRCVDGAGPIDQFRVSFTVDCSLDSVLTYLRGIKSHHPMNVGSFLYVIDKGEGWRQVYRAVKMPWLWSQRDFVYTEHTRHEEGGDVLVCSRSSMEVYDASHDTSASVGRVRGLMKVEGTRLRPLGPDVTEVTIALDLDLAALHYAETSFALRYLRETVDLHRKFAERNSRGASMSEPPKPTPLTRRLVAVAAKKGIDLTANPIFNRGSSGDGRSSGDVDKINIEMGRTVKGKIKNMEKKETFSL